jgi:RNA polymerase sigma factor (sigma-70 family)
MTPSDADLLREYAANTPRAQAAFATLVERHLNLVYSVARRILGSSHLAEDVAQSVFIDLARGARTFNPNTPLIAWLHLVSRRTAIDVVRRESRRLAREHEAAAISAMKSPSRDWANVEPLLDDAVETLSPADRAAILLRFFENKSLREVGAALGASDDAAQKRVTRAVEQLREFFLRRGITLTADGLATDLSAHAIEAAPTALGTSIAATAALSTAPAAATFTSTVLMTTLQKSTVLAAFAVAGGALVYQASVLARQSSELSALHAQIAFVTAHRVELQSGRSAIATKLREVEQRIDARLTQAIPVAPADAALESQMKEWLTQLDQLKQLLARQPELNIPELQLLNEQQWFSVASGGQLDSEEKLRRATSRLRHQAENMAAAKIFKALQAYVRAHDDTLPNHARDLAPHFNPPIDSAILERYQMLHTGKASDVPSSRSVSYVMVPKTQADPELDARFGVGLNGYGNTGVRR